MVQELVYLAAFIGLVLVIFAGAMSWRLFFTQTSRAPDSPTWNDTPEVRKILYTLIVATGICAVAAMVGVVLAMIRIF